MSISKLSLEAILQGQHKTIAEQELPPLRDKFFDLEARIANLRLQEVVLSIADTSSHELHQIKNHRKILESEFSSVSAEFNKVQELIHNTNLHFAVQAMHDAAPTLAAAAPPHIIPQILSFLGDIEVPNPNSGNVSSASGSIEAA